MTLVRGFGSPLYTLVQSTAVSALIFFLILLFLLFQIGLLHPFFFFFIPINFLSLFSSSSQLSILHHLLQVLVEMEKAADAQKLLNYVSSNSLKINGKAINVTFSREFRSLM